MRSCIAHISIAIICCLPLASRAGVWYAAPDGTSSNSGSITSPWSLVHALTRPSTVIKPGDTLLLRKGTYIGPFTSSLSGTAALPIWVRNMPNEKVTLLTNATGAVNQVVLTINGPYCNFMGLEVTTNSITRVSTGTTDPPPDIYSATGVNIYGLSTKLINCIVHDCSQAGVGFWGAALNAEVYGCIVYNNGFTNTVRGHGPGIYAQNSDETKPKSINNCILFNGYSVGIQFYSSSQDILRGLIIDSCTVFNSGANAAATQTRRMNLLAGGANSSGGLARVRDLVVSNSVFYRDTTDNSAASIMPYSTNRKNVELGTEDETLWDISVYFNKNHLYGDPTPLLWHRWDSGSFKRNFIYSYKSSYSGNRNVLELMTSSVPFQNWDSNTYHINQPTYNLPFDGISLADWRATYNVDANATLTNANPSTNQYFIRRNKYEPYKYHVTVMNYNGSNTVALPIVDPSFTNASYAVFDVQSSLSTPLDTGTYNGSTINLNMNNTNAYTLVGTSPVVPKHSSKTLGTFIIEFYPECVTTKAGNWYDPTVWQNGKVPDHFNRVRIGHDVTISSNAWCRSVRMTNNAQVILKQGMLLNVGKQ